MLKFDEEKEQGRGAVMEGCHSRVSARDKGERERERERERVEKWSCFPSWNRSDVERNGLRLARGRDKVRILPARSQRSSQLSKQDGV